MSPRDRDVYEPKPPRAQTQPGVVRDEVRPETSQAIEDPAARAAWRAQQDHVERTAKLEGKHDELAKAHQALEVKVAGGLGDIHGQLKLITPMIQASDDERKARRQREIDAEAALEKQRARRAVWWKQFFKVLGSIVGATVTIYGIYYGIYRGVR